MLYNYLITALRNAIRHKLYSFINIAGLAVGLLCAVFIVLFLRYELSYDRWIPDSAGLYRVEVTGHNPGQPPLHFAGTSFPLPHAMLQQLPEIKAATLLTPENMTVTVRDRQFPESVDVVDPNFLDVVKLPLVEGIAAAALHEPDSIVISESAARKYFGSADPMGRTVEVSGLPWYGSDQLHRQSMVVKAVMRDIPKNSQLSGEILLPNNSKADLMPEPEKQSWGNINSFGYVALQHGATVAQVMPKINALMDRSVDPMKLVHVNLKGSQILETTLTPFWDVHLSTDRYGGMTPGGSWATVYGFAVIGILILLVACFNFTNLATARAMIRAKEISLRKVMGARRIQLILQFLAESAATALVSLVLALSFAEIFLPAFSNFLGAPIELRYFSDWRLILAVTGVAVLAGLISGAYPALVLSNFRPALVLRTNRSGLSGSGILRTTLVVLQFAVSIGLGIAALVVFEQVSYARNMDLGFNRNNIVIVNAGNLATGARESFARALRTDPEIQDAALSSATPFAEGLKNNAFVKIPGHAFNDSFRDVAMSPGFLKAYGIPVVTGRPLSDAYGSDHFVKDGVAYDVLINETAARRLGFTPFSVIGKSFILDDTRVTVVGVSRDFKIEGARVAPAATIYRNVPTLTRYVSVRLKPGRLGEGLSHLDRVWRGFAPSAAIERHFLDRDFDLQYQADQKQDSVFGLFVGIAIFIACLGLFGLAAFSTERRTKEIGIRKSFGAEAKDIVLMLLWQFSMPVLVANLIAWPVAYYYLSHWLEGYAYRIPLSPLYFLAAGAAALVIAWATVYAHAARVARANPVHALRYE
ncbi:MAG TPA: ABC transporter permease [Rhizomicrobium sp.]|nr:ABC transporter permease [Rhizomicrobium sp.]